MRLFKERPFSDAAKIVLSNIEQSVLSTPVSIIKKDNLETLAMVISKNHYLSPPELYFEKMSVETVMGKRSGREYPDNADVDRSLRYDCALVNYTIPINPKSNLKLLTITPTSGSWTYEAELVEQYNLRFTIKTFHPTTELPEPLAKELETKAFEVIKGIKLSLNLLKGDCDKLNQTLEGYTLIKLKKV